VELKERSLNVDILASAASGTSKEGSKKNIAAFFS